MKNSWILGLLLVITSCQIEVDLALAEIESEIPVIEGVWTDNPNLNEVKITLAKNFLDQDSFTIIKESQVYIRVKGTETILPLIHI